jgi:hypothetical protein
MPKYGIEVEKEGHALYRIILAILTVLFVRCTPLAAQKSPVPAVHFSSLGEVTEVMIEVAPDVRYTANRLSNPDRIVFDIEGDLSGTGIKGLKTIPVGDALLKQIRVAPWESSGRTRVVLDLAQPVEFVASRLSNPNRLSIDLRSKNGTPPVASTVVTGTPVRFSSLGEVTRVAIDIPSDVHYTSSRLSNPDRILFDIKGLLPKIETKDALIPVGDARLKQIRLVETQPGVTRLVLDLAQPVEFNAFRFSNPQRMVIELRAAIPQPPAPAPLEVAEARPPADPPAFAREPQLVAASPPTIPVTEPAVSAPHADADTDVPEPPASETEEPKRAPSPVLSSALVVSGSVPVQPPKPSYAGVQKVVPLQGAEGMNDISTGSAIEPVVEVRDGRDLPLPGVDVTFQLPTTGPGGFFPGRTFALNTRTNERGQAAGTGFTPNNLAGRFVIRVTAASENQTASLLINQRNVRDNTEAARLTSAKTRSLKWKIISIAAGAAVTVGIIAATHGGGGGSSTAPSIPNSVSVGAGPITIGGPH